MSSTKSFTQAKENIEFILFQINSQKIDLCPRYQRGLVWNNKPVFKDLAIIEHDQKHEK